MTTKDVLIAARKLIEKPEQWGQGAFEEGGRICGSEAVRLAVGASESRADYLHSPAYVALLTVVGFSPFAGGFSEFNDSHTHAEVLAVFDRAIEAQGE